MSSRSTTPTLLERHSDEENPPSPPPPAVDDEHDSKEHDGRKMVEFAKNEDPKNWSTLRKAWITAQLAVLALAASAGSSIISPVCLQTRVVFYFFCTFL